MCKSSFLIYHNHQTIDTHHVSKLLRKGSSGLQEENEEEKENEGNELFFPDFVSPIKSRRKEV